MMANHCQNGAENASFGRPFQRGGTSGAARAPLTIAEPAMPADDDCTQCVKPALEFAGVRAGRG